MKTKVFQVRRNAFDKDGNLIPKEQRTTKVLCIGTVVIPDRKKGKELLEEDIWDMFNWTCWYWRRGRRNAYHYAIRKGIRRRGIRMFPNRNADGFCNSDIFFKLWDKWYVADHVGFDSANSYEEAMEKSISIQRF